MDVAKLREAAVRANAAHLKGDVSSAFTVLVSGVLAATEAADEPVRVVEVTEEMLRRVTMSLADVEEATPGEVARRLNAELRRAAGEG